MDLNRNITAYALVFFYIFYIKDRFKYGGLSLPLFVVVTSYIHISVMVLWFFYMVSRFFPINRRVGYLIIYISAFLGLSLPVLMPLLENIISLMPGPIGSRIYFYIYGSEFGVQVFSLGQDLQKMLNFTVIFLAGIYTLKLKNEETSKDENRNFDFILMVIALTMITLMYMTLFERLNLATNFIYGYLLLRYYRQKIYNKFILAMITFRSVVINFVVYVPLILFKNAGVFDTKADIVGMALKPLYINTFYLLDFKHDYTDRYLINHLLWGR